MQPAFSKPRQPYNLPWFKERVSNHWLQEIYCVVGVCLYDYWWQSVSHVHTFNIGTTISKFNERDLFLLLVTCYCYKEHWHETDLNMITWMGAFTVCLVFLVFLTVLPFVFVFSYCVARRENGPPTDVWQCPHVWKIYQIPFFSLICLTKYCSGKDREIYFS